MRKTRSVIILIGDQYNTSAARENGRPVPRLRGMAQWDYSPGLTELHAWPQASKFLATRIEASALRHRRHMSPVPDLRALRESVRKRYPSMLSHGEAQSSNDQWADHGASPAEDVMLDESPVLGMPTYLTPLIGRDDERRQLGEHLTGTGQSLVVITGSGGIGKTRLAVQTDGATIRSPGRFSPIHRSPASAWAWRRLELPTETGWRYSASHTSGSTARSPTATPTGRSWSC